MKYLALLTICDAHSRSPCGERGLKFVLDVVAVHIDESLPVRGAWIEIRKR